MFTGLVETTGSLASLEIKSGGTRLVIHAPELAGRWRTGDSIAVNGVCLTALPVDSDANDTGKALAETVQSTHFAADLAQETLDRTSLRQLIPGTPVNLELPTPAGAPLGGHVVQGHIDATGTLVSLLPLHPEDPGATDWRLALDLPPQLATQVIPQGSITVDGISLTVASVDGPRVEIAVIPHTYRSTNLRALQPGDKVNLETDVLAKYAARQIEAKEKMFGAATSQPQEQDAKWLTSAYLLANGY